MPVSSLIQFGRIRMMAVIRLLGWCQAKKYARRKAGRRIWVCRGFLVMGRQSHNATVCSRRAFGQCWRRSALRQVMTYVVPCTNMPGMTRAILSAPSSTRNFWGKTQSHARFCPQAAISTMWGGQSSGGAGEPAIWRALRCANCTSLCPVTGQPDFAASGHRYARGSSIVESKSGSSVSRIVRANHAAFQRRLAAVGIGAGACSRDAAQWAAKSALLVSAAAGFAIDFSGECGGAAQSAVGTGSRVVAALSGARG